MSEPVENTIDNSIVLGHVVQAGRIGQVVLPSTAPLALFGLPPDPPEFTGRDVELATLLDAPTTVLSGLPGVGKTALAVHAAHRFGGDVLFINLAGYDPDGRVPPTAALATFLHSLGVSSNHIPPDLASREALYRSLLASRSPLLIVLDNAASTDQVIPLLADRHKMLITSRHRLADLPGARQIELAVLTTGDAVALVTTALAQRRDTDDRTGTPELAQVCGHLPLALSIAAAILADDPELSVAELTDMLHESSPLDELRYGDSPGVRAAFDLSYARLTEEERRVFVSFAVHLVTRLTVEAVAAVNDLPVAAARRVLRSLHRAHLVESGQELGWYVLHDLLSTYTRTLVLTEWTSDTLDEARQRFLDYLDAGLHEVSKWVDSDEPPADPQFRDAAHAFEWVRREELAIVCGSLLAVQLPEWRAYSAVLADHATGYVLGHHDWQLGIILFENALAVAEQVNDGQQEGQMLVNLGLIDRLRYDQEFGADQARAKFFRAASLLFDPDAPDTVDMLQQLLRGVAAGKKLEPEEVARCLTSAREESDALVRAQALTNLGDHYRAMAKYEEAVEHFRTAAAITRGLPVDRAVFATLLSRIATIEFRLARYKDAGANWTEAIAELEALGLPVERLCQNLTALPDLSAAGN